MAYKKGREMITHDRNTKIKDMNMDELRSYLCMKNNQNPTKCEQCPGLANCTAGQRAMVLLNEMELEKMKNNTDIQQNRYGSVKQRQEISRKKFMNALNQPDMIQYLMDTYGNTRNCARENLKHWAKTFPDLAERYEFEKKFSSLARASVVAISGSALEKQRQAKEKYAEAASQADPIAFMVEKYGIDRAKAAHNFWQWKRRYGEIKEEKAVENEEVSVEDFLKEVENTTERAEKSVEEASVPETENHPAGEQNHFFGHLNAKYNELAAEKERLKDRLAWIEKAQDALAMTLNIFNPESAIAKGIFGE